AGDGEGPLLRAGGEDNLRGADDARLAVERQADLERSGRGRVVGERPHRAARRIGGGGALEAGDDVGPAPVVVAKHGAFRDRRGGDGAVDLAAGGRVLVGEQHGQAEIGRAGGGGKPGRAAADHDEAVTLGKGGEVPGGGHRRAAPT